MEHLATVGMHLFLIGGSLNEEAWEPKFKREPKFKLGARIQNGSQNSNSEFKGKKNLLGRDTLV